MWTGTLVEFHTRQGCSEMHRSGRKMVSELEIKAFTWHNDDKKEREDIVREEKGHKHGKWVSPENLCTRRSCNKVEMPFLWVRNRRNDKVKTGKISSSGPWAGWEAEFYFDI